MKELTPDSQMERLRQLDAFIRQRPDDPFLHYARMLELMRLERPEEAEQAIEYMLSRHADYLGTYYPLARYYLQGGRADEARGILDKGLELALQQRDSKTAAEIRALREELDEA